LSLENPYAEGGGIFLWDTLFPALGRKRREGWVVGVITGIADVGGVVYGAEARSA